MKTKKSILRNSADWLARRVNKSSAFQQKLVFIIFLIPVTIYCTYLLLGGATAPLSIAPINIPLISNEPPQHKKEIMSYNSAPDSLKKVFHGKGTPDSVFQSKPSMMDTIYNWKY